MGYVTIDDLRSVAVPTVDVEVGGQTYKIAALTRAQLKWAMNEVGYTRSDDGMELSDAEEADLLMLAVCLIEPAIDENDTAHLDLLRGLPVGYVKELTEAMMVLSGLREEDPTSATDE